MRKPVVVSISAALVVGLTLAVSAIRSQTHRSGSFAGGSGTPMQARGGVPVGTDLRNTAAVGSVVAVASRASASRAKALPQVTASRPSSQPAGTLSVNQPQGIRRAPQTRPWAAVPGIRMQAAGRGPSSRPAEPFLSTPQARIKAAAPMARRLTQAAGSQPYSQPAADTARLMQRRSAQSPMAASHANLWAYAGRAKAQTQSAASGPSSQPHGLASQALRLHEVRRGEFRGATTRAVSLDGIDESGSSESTGGR